jgi:hypothetical protein
VVQHHVPADPPHAAGAQLHEGGLDALEHQLRVAPALDVQVALQRALGDGAIGVEARLPRVLRAQHVQCRHGRDELHDRGRVHGGVRPVAQPGRVALQWQHQHGDGITRHAGPRQCGGDLRRQRLLGAGRGGTRGAEAGRRSASGHGGRQGGQHDGQ